MHNCLVLGSGRSGTSMVAGTLATAGYYMGGNLIPPRDANPKGFFETSFINRTINEAIMEPHIQGLRPGQYWLAALPKSVKFVAPPVVVAHIKNAVSKSPYCYKDPRFSYTLPAWRPFLQATRFICVFRHPAETAASLMKECQTARYLYDVHMTPERAFHIYNSIYGAITSVHAKVGKWLFVSFDQMLTPIGIRRLSDFLAVQVDANFPEERYKRSKATLSVPKETLELYHKLVGFSQ